MRPTYSNADPYFLKATAEEMGERMLVNAFVERTSLFATLGKEGSDYIETSESLRISGWPTIPIFTDMETIGAREPGFCERLWMQYKLRSLGQ